MAEPTEQGVTQPTASLQKTLTEADFSDRAAIDKIARLNIGSLYVKAEQFKEHYDAIKPENVPEWDHNRSLEAFDAQVGEEARGDNFSTIARIGTEKGRVNAELVQPKQEAESGRDRDDVERERENVASQYATESTGAQQSQAGDEVLVATRAPAAEETIENRGAVTESRIQARPEELDARFTIQAKGGSERYYHKDSEQEAFRDTGKKIIVKPESRKLVAADVAKLADAKGWADVKVTGNANFRRDVWKEANLRGIEVVGYIPTEQDKRDLDKRLASVEAAPRDNQSEKENKKIAPKVAVGTVGDSKSANPEVNETAAKRAQLANAYANDSREDAVSKHPELKELYGLEKAAQQFAGSSIESPRSQEQFVATVRDRGLDELSKGNKLPELKVAPIQPQPDRGAGLGR